MHNHLTTINITKCQEIKANIISKHCPKYAHKYIQDKCKIFKKSTFIFANKMPILPNIGNGNPRLSQHFLLRRNGGRISNRLITSGWRRSFVVDLTYFIIRVDLFGCKEKLLNMDMGRKIVNLGILIISKSSKD